MLSPASSDAKRNHGIPTISLLVWLLLSLFCVPVVLLIAFWPDVLISAIHGLGISDKETLFEKVNQLFVDIMLMYGVGTMLILADAMCRKKRGQSLIHSLFFDRQNSGVSARFQTCALAASIIGAVIILDFLLMGRNQKHWLYVEDGPIENLTALSFALAGFLLAWTTIRFGLTAKADPASKSKRQRNSDRLTIAGRGILGLMLIIVAGEEISWGQRIFGIETPVALSEVNTQNEFNLHNIFTDYFKYAYFIIAIIVFSVTWYSFQTWANRQSDRVPSLIAEFLPHPALLLLAAQILCFSFHLMFNEMVEPIAAMYILLYSWQLCVPSSGLAKVASPQPNPAASRSDDSRVGVKISA